MGATLPLKPGRFSGRSLGKYEVLSRLSTGGMSEIYLAYQRGLAGFQKLVVLKSILPDIRGEEEFVRMFLDEARITAAFNHPNIAQVFDLDVDDGELFLAMEFVTGCTLVEVARACRAANQAIPIGFTLSAVRDAAQALHYAHTFTDPLGRKQTVIHRDVAEKNIMVTYEGTTKLLDFGIAKSLARSGRTQVGMVKGTSGYMSPEQIMGEQLDPRSDVFSLGVVLHECLTGMRLFYGPNPEDGMMATLKGEVSPPSKINRQVTPQLDAVCLKALARRREDRHASALEFARELERAALPLFWKPEQSGELIQSLFADRREQTRVLYEKARSALNDSTGDINLEGLLGQHPKPSFPKGPPPPPPIAPPPSIPVVPVDTRQESIPGRRPLEAPPPSESRRRAETTDPGQPMEEVAPERGTLPLADLPRELQEPERDTTNQRRPSAEVPLARSSSPTHPNENDVHSRPTNPLNEQDPSWRPTKLVTDTSELFAEQSSYTDSQSVVQKRGSAPPWPIVLLLLGGLVFGLLYLFRLPPFAEPPASPPVSTPTPPETDQPPPTQVAKDEPPVPPPPVAAPTPPPVKEVRPASTTPPPVKKPTRITRVERPPPTVEKPKKPGMLTLVTDPFAQVFYKSQDLGTTPLFKVSLPAGKHTLRLLGPNRQPVLLPVEIKEGQVTAVRVSLTELKSD